MTEVVVVGAGPYGISIATHLREIGLGVRVFGDPMASWHDHMPEGMYLKSTPDASSLSAPKPGSSIVDYCAEIGSRALADEKAIPIRLFIAYGLWFAERHVPDVEPESVVHLARAGREFELHLDSGEELYAESVVIACGAVPYAYTPPELLTLIQDRPAPDAVLSHTAQHGDLSGFAGRRVAVVGAGQSALESAALLTEAGADVHVLARVPRIDWGNVPDGTPDTCMRRLVKPPSALGSGWSRRSVSDAPGLVRYLPARARLALVKSVLGPSGAWWLRDRVEDRVDLRTGVSVQSAVARAGGGARIALSSRKGGGDVLDVDHVLAATGYRVDLDALGFLSPGLRASLRRVGGSPRLNAAFESSVPGLYFAGLAAATTFGPLLRFVHGADFAAKRISAAVPERHRNLTT